ncbi:MAG: GldG family protein [Cyanobacteriota bacterium]
MSKYFILFGIIFIIIGAVAGYVAGEWIPVPIGILAGGTLILIVGFIILSRGFWRRRSTQTGLNALIATIALVTILVSLNIIAINYGRTFDLTETNLYTLASQSQQLVENLEQPLKVFVFESPPTPESERLLKKYQSYSENFEFEFVDPQQDIAKVESFGVESFGEVYIEYGDKTQFVQEVNELEPLSEIELTNAINIIQRDRVSFAYFLQGHGEPPLEEVQGGFSQSVASLEQQGYQVEPFNFAEETNLPSSPNSVLIIVSPQQDLFPGEIESIQNYVAAGGHLFLLLDRDSSESLEPLLDFWGIELDDRVIVDASGKGEALGFNPATALVTNYGDHPITNPLENGISVYPLSRPIDVREMPGVEATPLAFTNEESWAESDITQEQLQYNPERDRAGPLVLAFALERTEVTDAEESSEETPEEENQQEEIIPPSERTQSSSDNNENNPEETNDEEEEITETPEESEDEEETENDLEELPEPSLDSRVVIFGNSEFAKNGLFIQQLNGDIFLNSVDWLVSSDDDEVSLGLRPTEETNRRINLTTQQANILRNIAMLVVPLFGVMLAIISWLRRR